MFKNNLIKISIWTSLFFFFSFLLFHVRQSGFVSTKEVLNDWNTNLYTNTTKIITIGLIIVSISVAFSFVTIQNLNRNNIATASTLGIGSAASFGYILGSYLKVKNSIFILLLMLIGALIPIWINFLLLRKNKKIGNKSVLIGLAITALISVVNYIIRDLQKMQASSLIWLSNLDGNPEWNKLWFVIPMMTIGILILIFNSKKIDLINKATLIANKSSFSPVKVHLLVSLANLLIIISSIYFIGQIVFMGIIASNILRYILKTNNTLKLVFFSIIINIFLLFIAQILYYYFLIEKSITILFFSAPIFVFVIWKEGGSNE